MFLLLSAVKNIILFLMCVILIHSLSLHQCVRILLKYSYGTLNTMCVCVLVHWLIEYYCFCFFSFIFDCKPIHTTLHTVCVRVHSTALYCVQLIIVVFIALFHALSLALCIGNDKLLHKNNGHALGYLMCHSK